MTKLGNIIKRILKEDEGKHPLLGVHAIFDSSSNKEDIYKVLEILKNAGIPDNPDYDWIDDDVDTVYDDYIRHGIDLYLVANQHDRFGYVVGWGGAKFLNQNNILKLPAKEWIEIFSTDTSTFFDHLNEQEDDLQWARDVVNSENSLFGIKPFNSYDRNYSYIVFVGKDRTTEEIKLISEVLHKLGWRWAGGENATYSSHLKSISTYSRRSPETYIYMDYAGKMYYGSTISTFIQVNGRETYDNAIKIYL